MEKVHQYKALLLHAVGVLKAGKVKPEDSK